MTDIDAWYKLISHSVWMAGQLYALIFNSSTVQMYCGVFSLNLEHPWAVVCFIAHVVLSFSECFITKKEMKGWGGNSYESNPNLKHFHFPFELQSFFATFGTQRQKTRFFFCFYTFCAHNDSKIICIKLSDLFIKFDWHTWWKLLT